MWGYIEEVVWRGSPISEVKMVRQGKASRRRVCNGGGEFLGLEEVRTAVGECFLLPPDVGGSTTPVVNM